MQLFMILKNFCLALFNILFCTILQNKQCVGLFMFQNQNLSQLLQIFFWSFLCSSQSDPLVKRYVIKQWACSPPQLICILPGVCNCASQTFFPTYTYRDAHRERGVRGQTERRGIPDKPVAWRRAQREEWQLCRAFTTLCGVTKQSLSFSRLSKTPLWCEERAFISHTHSTHAPPPQALINTHSSLHTGTHLNENEQ